MKPVKTISMTLACLSCLLLVACRSVRRGDAIGRPVAKASAEVERGRMVFQQRCDRCHPGGEGGLGPSLNDKLAPGFLIKTQVRAGLGAMPRFGEDLISGRELDDLVAYVMALRHAEQVKAH